MCVAFLVDEERLGSAAEPRGLLWVLEILFMVPGLASVVRESWGSASLPTNMSRLVETAGCLEDRLDRPKRVELGNCTIVT